MLIFLTKITEAQNEVAFSYHIHRVPRIYFLAVVFVVTLVQKDSSLQCSLADWSEVINNTVS